MVQDELFKIQANSNIHDVILIHFLDDPDFSDLVYQGEVAIDAGVYPERIYQGSSGSYFVKNTYGVSFDPE